MKQQRWRKIAIMVDCPSPEHEKAVQDIFNEISGIIQLDANSIIQKAPTFRKNESALRSIFSIISKGGINAKTISKIALIASQTKK